VVRRKMPASFSPYFCVFFSDGGHPAPMDALLPGWRCLDSQGNPHPYDMLPDPPPGPPPPAGPRPSRMDGASQSVSLTPFISRLGGDGRGTATVKGEVWNEEPK